MGAVPGAGRKRKPIKMHLLEGNPSQLRKSEIEAREKEELKVPCEMPEMPDYLDKIAAAEWKRVSEILFKLGIIHTLDMSQLANYCMTYSKWVQVEKMLKKAKWIQKIKLDNGQYHYTLKNHDLYREAKDLSVKLKGFCSEFGMSPSARSRMAMPGTKNDEDDFEKLLDS